MTIGLGFLHASDRVVLYDATFASMLWLPSHRVGTADDPAADSTPLPLPQGTDA
ncbi:UNVERIFIED_ORG: hypothetical protein QE398_000100 [Atlantibacter sp. SORGH_AS 304]|nr:hypothetical protein [Atlantibacter sp. SORGH_AS_0304]